MDFTIQVQLENRKILLRIIRLSIVRQESAFSSGFGFDRPRGGGYGAPMTRRKLPIGIQTFREIREEGCYYFAPELPDLDRDRIRHWYNGYCWLGEEKVYNPFDILLLFDTREFKAHWFETGTPRFLIDTLLRRGVASPELDGMMGTDALLSAFDVDEKARGHADKYRHLGEPIHLIRGGVQSGGAQRRRVRGGTGLSRGGTTEIRPSSGTAWPHSGCAGSGPVHRPCPAEPESGARSWISSTFCVTFNR